MSSDLSEDELYSEEEEVDSDQLDPIPDEPYPAEVDEEFPPNNNEMEEQGTRIGSVRGL